MPVDFEQIDAFSHRPLYGNPAAVVFDADDIPTATMQKIAREMNLSETVFILRPTTPEADYRVRIFTPLSELPFAGHPTVAASHAVLTRFPEKAEATLLRQECGIGIVPVEVLPSPSGGKLLRMTQAKPEYRSVGIPRELMAKMLGCSDEALAETPFEVVSTGVPWLIVQLSRFAAMPGLEPDMSLIASECKSVGAAGITVFVERSNGGPVRIRVRTFAPGEGVNEDPVCGSGNGSVAAYMAKHVDSGQSAGHYLAEQGIEIDRDGIVDASWSRAGDDLQVKIAGENRR
ncbi:PhzF family phenazine biosynthesis protein [Parahaliea maris]|uniref:PhzF family phenazine biosynthesis protein n=1 Tax=Parahaliea maris TaxID=2716870 RepID=UPI001BB3C07B|nr:PhzF family phenazine biosynthesis protein [Parahaliea maris]